MYRVLLLFGVLTFAGFCLREVESSDIGNGENPSVTDQQFPRRVESEHLPNLVQIHPRVFVGGAPGDPGSVDELKRLGVKTIISVDSATPNLELSAGSDARYVHLPIGYDSVTKQRAIELAKAIHQGRGNIYLHCHHGQHRAPAAAAVACVTAGMISPAQAIRILETAGTAKRYQGLYRSVQAARAIKVQMIDEYVVEFREQAEVSPLAKTMVDINHSMEVIGDEMLSRNDGAESRPPDLKTNPSHHAVLLEEHFVELIRMKDSEDRSQGFLNLLKESRQQAGRIRTLTEPPSGLETVGLKSTLQELKDNCTKCHSRFRNRG